MNLPFIGALLARGIISPAVARGLETLIVGLAASFVIGAGDVLLQLINSGSIRSIDWNTVLVAGTTAVMLYLRKRVSDALIAAKAEAQKQLEAEQAGK